MIVNPVVYAFCLFCYVAKTAIKKFDVVALFCIAKASRVDYEIPPTWDQFEIPYQSKLRILY